MKVAWRVERGRHQARIGPRRLRGGISHCQVVANLCCEGSERHLHLPERVLRGLAPRTASVDDLDLLLVTLWVVGVTAIVVIKYVPLML